uniref:Uncharacterized protein n=1 Tax=Anguilla anguilla TaxID=7936 RepID=A0A0E9TRF9_ANGAN
MHAVLMLLKDMLGFQNIPPHVSCPGFSLVQFSECLTSSNLPICNSWLRVPHVKQYVASFIFITKAK